MAATFPTNFPPAINQTINSELDEVRCYDVATLDARIKRAKMFLAEHEKGRAYIAIQGKVIQRSAIGGGIGLLLGTGAAILLAPTPTTIMRGAVAGSLIGAGIGAAVSVVREYRNIKLSGVYDQWKTKAKANKTYEIFEKHLKEMLDRMEFEGLMCNINASLCRVPVRCPTGHLFDQSAILIYLHGKGGRAECPLRCRMITADDLTYQANYHHQVVQRLLPDLLNLQVAAEVREGLGALAQDAQENTASVIKSSTDVLLNKFKNSKCSKEEFMEQMKNILDQNPMPELIPIPQSNEPMPSSTSCPASSSCKSDSKKNA